MKQTTLVMALALFILSGITAWAQNDVTSTYLLNSNFDTSCNYKAGDAAANLPTSDDGTKVLEVPNWIKQSEGWTAGATFEYGYAGTLNAPGPIPSTAADGTTTGSDHGALGICAAWTGTVLYYQAVTLPAGSYKLSYNAYNSGPAAYSASLVGFVPVQGQGVLSALTSFTQNQWTTDEINFTLDTETTGKIQIGIAAQDAGSGSHGRIFFDNLQLQYSTVSTDAALADIQLSTGTLNTIFSSSKTEYTVYLTPETTSVEVTAVANDNAATVVGDGTISLVNGEGEATINVTAEDGKTTKKYVVKFQVNHTSQWDGAGATGAGSEPGNFGWDCTPAVTWSEANVFGIRYQDNVSYEYNGSTQTGRILYVRWDGVGGTTGSSIYSYPVTNLKACTTYLFEAKIAWNSNGGATSYGVAINSAKDNSGTSLTKDAISVSTAGELKDISLIFTPKEDGDYYFTLGSSSAVLGAITDLSLSTYNGDAFIQVDTKEMSYDSTKLSQSFQISAYGLNQEISFTAPQGMHFTPATLSAQDAQCGATITATFESADAIKDGQININSGTLTEAINIKKVLPAFMMPGTAEFTTDGTWCWFQDPRAVYYEGTKKQTYSGWITSKGKVEVASYNHETGEIIKTLISPPDFMQIDDHNNPTILVREDGRVMVSYSGHFYGPMRVIVSTNPEDITSFGAEANFGDNVTYANPYQIGDSTVMFYRDGVSWHPTINVSLNGGITWATPQTLITGGGQRPYAKYTQDSKGGIHIIFTTGHPRQEATNKVYYVYFKNNKFYKADGTFIKEFKGTSTALNITAGEPEVIYNAAKGKGWTCDIALDKDEHPVALYAAFPDDYNHHYYYASWNGSAWVTNHIVNSGKWFPQTPEGATEPEPNYSGGMVLDPNNPSVVYLSKQVNNVFEIFKYETDDRGANWQTTALTANTPEGIINVRPVVPRGHKPGSFDVMWLRGTYVTYANYLTQVMYYSPAATQADLDSVLVDGQRLTTWQPTDTPHTVTLPAGTTVIPQVQGYSDVSLVQIEVTQATTLPGKATINVTSDGGATTNTFTIEFKLEDETSTNDATVELVHIYPNPTCDDLHIDLTGLTSVKSVALLDINGRILKQIDQITAATLTFSMAQLIAGAYIVQIVHQADILHKKVTKID